ncbi:MAG: response regulator [Nitrospirae bacterium]|nr:response regulator [Nitrospirota bacterium]
MKILIADDNSDDRKLLRYIIERQGYEVIEAEDGQKGLEMAAAHRPDMIVSDALMPVMDGFQFLRNIKTDEILKSIPFIFYSATYKGYLDVQLAMSLGAEAYIIKPKDPLELWEEIEIIIKEGKKEKVVTAELVEEDEEYLRKYSQVVAIKLEEKIKELEESEAFIKNILETVDEGFIVIDPEYRIISANKAYLNMVNMPLEDVIGKYCYELSHHIYKPCFERGENCAVSRTFATGEPDTVIHTHHDKDGNPVYVETKSYPMKDPGGKVVSVIEVIHNITERKKAEEEIKRRIKELEDFYEMAVGRELRMKELKEKIKELEDELATYKRNISAIST